MRVEKHPYNYSFDKFRPRRFVLIGELDALYSAESNGKYYLIWDSSDIAEFWLNQDPVKYKSADFQESITVWEFETFEERNLYMQDHYSEYLNDSSKQRIVDEFNRSRGYTD